MYRILSRRMILLAVASVTALLVAAPAPASAACVTLGAAVRIGTTTHTVLPDGTCVVPTPFPAYTYREVNYGSTAAGVHVRTDVPFPPVSAPAP